MRFQMMLTLLVYRPHLRTAALDHGVTCGEAVKELYYNRKNSLNTMFGMASLLTSCLRSIAILVHISGPQVSYG